MNENEHLQCSKLVGSPFLFKTGFSQDGTGPVSIPIAGLPAGGGLRTGVGELLAIVYSSGPGRGGNGGEGDNGVGYRSDSNGIGDLSGYDPSE